MSTVSKLAEKGLAHPPRWLPTNICYETTTGSVAYGVSSDTSDMDVCGFAIPPKEDVFPRGDIPGFGKQRRRFEQYQEQVFDKDVLGGSGRTYDLVVHSIVKFFELCRIGSPNMIDSLYTREECVLHCTAVGKMVRDNRRLFVSKEVWNRYRGYAWSQSKKMQCKDFVGQEILSRLSDIEARHDIDRRTNLGQIEEEMRRRGLL